MRLWHTALIPYLPRQQLLGQWRELNSIYKLKNKHILINFVYEYPKIHLLEYSKLIIAEMQSRGYKFNLDNCINYFKGSSTKEIIRKVFPTKMTKRYLKQCLYNLQEKYDCRWNYKRRMESNSK